MYQHTMIIGRLGRDPELRYTPAGDPVCSFSVATDRKWTDSGGEKQQRTTWFQVTAWRRLAETCNQYLSKGRLVMVEGTLREPKPWQGRDGDWRANLPLTAFNVKFLGSSRESRPEEGPDIKDLDDEEIPF